MVQDPQLLSGIMSNVFTGDGRGSAVGLCIWVLSQFWFMHELNAKNSKCVARSSSEVPLLNENSTEMHPDVDIDGSENLNVVPIRQFIHLIHLNEYLQSSNMDAFNRCRRI